MHVVEPARGDAFAPGFANAAGVVDVAEWVAMGLHESLLERAVACGRLEPRQTGRGYAVIEFALCSDGRWHQRDAYGRVLGSTVADPLDVDALLDALETSSAESSAERAKGGENAGSEEGAKDARETRAAAADADDVSGKSDARRDAKKKEPTRIELGEGATSVVADLASPDDRWSACRWPRCSARCGVPERRRRRSPGRIRESSARRDRASPPTLATRTALRGTPGGGSRRLDGGRATSATRERNENENENTPEGMRSGDGSGDVANVVGRPRRSRARVLFPQFVNRRGGARRRARGEPTARAAAGGRLAPSAPWRRRARSSVCAWTRSRWTPRGAPQQRAAEQKALRSGEGASPIFPIARAAAIGKMDAGDALSSPARDELAATAASGLFDAEDAAQMADMLSPLSGQPSVTFDEENVLVVAWTKREDGDETAAMTPELIKVPKGVTAAQISRGVAGDRDDDARSDADADGFAKTSTDASSPGMNNSVPELVNVNMEMVPADTPLKQGDQVFLGDER